MRGGFTKFGETSIYEVSLKPVKQSEELNGELSMNSPQNMNGTLSYGKINASLNRSGPNGKLAWTSPDQTGTLVVNNVLQEMSSADYPQSKLG